MTVSTGVQIMGLATKDNVAVTLATTEMIVAIRMLVSFSHVPM